MDSDPTPGNADMWFFQNDIGGQANTFPTAVGTFTNYWVYISDNDGPGTDTGVGTLTLSSPVPEPVSALLFASVAAALGFKYRRLLPGKSSKSTRMP